MLVHLWQELFSTQWVLLTASHYRSVVDLVQETWPVCVFVCAWHCFFYLSFWMFDVRTFWPQDIRLGNNYECEIDQHYQTCAWIKAFANLLVWLIFRLLAGQTWPIFCNLAWISPFIGSLLPVPLLPLTLHQITWVTFPLLSLPLSSLVQNLPLCFSSGYCNQ